MMRVVEIALVLHDCIEWSGVMAGKSKSLKGQLLLDSGLLAGSFFHQSVVLICEHDAEGAFGLVLNRRSENKVGEALLADLPEGLRGQELFLGGPVQPSVLSYLHSDGYLPEANIMTSLSLGHSLDQLLELAESFAPEKRLKVFAGYAGWSAGQLESEIARKAWIVHPAGLGLVFAEDPAGLWSGILRQKGWRYRLLADAPGDPSWN
jgi:putative transcriptional regulator